MKRQVQETGIRKWFGGDLISLQAEPFKAIDGHYEPYGNMIIKGCEVTGSDISAGIVGLKGKDDSNNDIYKVAVFEGLQAASSFPVYLVLTKTEETRLYNVGSQKKISITYKATPQYNLPTGEYLIINQDNNNKRYLDAIQSAAYRFVTDAKIAEWDAKASTAVATAAVNGLMSKTDKAKIDTVSENANYYAHPATHSPSIIAQDSNNRFVTDALIAGWNAAYDDAVLEIRDGAEQDKDTLKKLYDVISPVLLNGDSTRLYTTKKVQIGTSLSKTENLYVNGSGRFTGAFIADSEVYLKYRKYYVTGTTSNLTSSYNLLTYDILIWTGAGSSIDKVLSTLGIPNGRKITIVNAGGGDIEIGGGGSFSNLGISVNKTRSFIFYGGLWYANSIA